MNPSPVKSVLRRPAPPSGLGRGLARILDSPSTSDDGRASAGLGQLLGPIARSRSGQLRPFILRVALNAVAESFRAEGAVLALRPRVAHSPRSVTEPATSEEPTVVTQLPPSWTANSSAMFELHGRLWSLSHIHQESDQTWSDQYRIGEFHVWMVRLPGFDGPAGAAFVRTTRFDPAETHALERSIASALSALAPARRDSEAIPLSTTGRPFDVHPSDPGQRPAASEPVLTASVTAEGDNMVAEVTFRRSDLVGDTTIREVAGDDGRAGSGVSGQATVIGTGRGPDATTAVARAAANACQPQRRVSFAGSLDVDGSTVTIVLVGGFDLDGRPPRLGVSIRPAGDVVGPAEAVFSATRTD